MTGGRTGVSLTGGGGVSLAGASFSTGFEVWS